jgi:hypothetical protein
LDIYYSSSAKLPLLLKKKKPPNSAADLEHKHPLAIHEAQKSVLHHRE